MNKRDVKNCNNINELKELCLAYRKAYACISETLVDESKEHISISTAKEHIRKYLRDIDYAEDKFVKKSIKKISKNDIKLGTKLEVIKEFTDICSCLKHTYKVGEKYTVISVSYGNDSVSCTLRNIDSEKDFIADIKYYEFIAKPDTNIEEYFKII